MLNNILIKINKISECNNNILLSDFESIKKKKNSLIDD